MTEKLIVKHLGKVKYHSLLDQFLLKRLLIELHKKGIKYAEVRKHVQKENYLLQEETTVRTDPLQLRPFSPHRVTCGGAEYWVYDAKALNRQANQSGRGNYRYLFSRGAYAGVAVHMSSGDYCKVA